MKCACGQEMKYRTAKNGATTMYCYLCELFPRTVPTKSELDAIRKSVEDIARPIWEEYDREQKRCTCYVVNGKITKQSKKDCPKHGQGLTRKKK